MKSKKISKAEQQLKKRLRWKKWKKLTGGAACIAAIGLYFAFARPAQTMETVCNIPEHTHTESCYAPLQEGQEGLEGSAERTPVCGLEEHIHDESCMEQPADAAESVEDEAEQPADAAESVEDEPEQPADAAESVEDEPEQPADAAGSAEDEPEQPADAAGSAEDEPEQPADASGSVENEAEQPADTAESVENAPEQQAADSAGAGETPAEPAQDNSLKLDTYADETGEQTMEDAAPKAGSSGTMEGGVSWELTDDGKLILSGDGTLSPEERPEITEDMAAGIVSLEIGEGVGGAVSIENMGWLIYCKNLEEISVQEGNQEISSQDGVLFNKDKTVLIFFPVGKEGSYTVPEGVTELGMGAFIYSKVSGITLPATLTTIGQQAFAMNTALQSVSIPQGVTEIPAQTFYGCRGLQKVEFPEGLTSIGQYAFLSCVKLSEAELPDSLTSIGSAAFAQSGLQSVTIPENVKEIGDQAFLNCTALNKLRLETGQLPQVNARTFSGCTGLQSVEIAKTVKSLDSSVFAAISSGTDLGNITLSAEPGTEFAFTGENVTVGGVRLLSGFTYTANESGALIQGEAGGSCGDNVHWTLDAEGTLTITGSGGMNDYSYSNLPPWSNVADLVKKVNVEEGVTSVSAYAFYYRYPNLTSVELADSVTSIGTGSFYLCAGLESIELPEALTSIGGMAFAGTGLHEVVLPESATSLGASLFSLCDNLVSVSLPENITEIPSGMFSGSEALASVQIPAGVTTIGSSAFSGCSGLTALQLPEEVKSLGNSCFRDCTSLKSVRIPESVTSLGSYVFSGCSSLSEAELSNGLEAIGQYMFEDCSSLESITLGPKISSVDRYAFRNCKNLKTVVVQMETVSDTSINSYAFSGCSGLEKIVIDAGTSKEIAYTALSNICNSSSSGSVTLEFRGPGAFTYSGSNFAGANITLTAGTYEVDEQGRLSQSGTCSTGLTWTLGFDGTLTITGPGTMKDFSSSAWNRAPWYNLRSMVKKVVIEDGVENVGDYAFYGCANLEEAVFADGFLDIGNYAFWQCAALERLTLPDSITTIGNYAFDDCVSLGEVRLPSGLKTAGRNVFSDCTDLAKVTVPKGVTKLGEYMFQNCTGLKEVTLPESLSSVASYAFSGCSSLAELALPEGLSSVASYAFSGCSSLRELTLPESLSSVASYAFSGCSSLAELTLPEGLSSVGSNAFSGCTALAELTLKSENLSSFSASAFSGCEELNIVYIHTDTTVDRLNRAFLAGLPSDIEAEFRGPGSFTFVGGEYTIDGRTLSAGGYLVDEQGNLSRGGELGDGVYWALQDGVLKIYGQGKTPDYTSSNYRNVPWYSFLDEITSVVVEEGVTGIGDHIFYKSALSEFTLPSSLETIGESAFAQCGSIKELDLPEGLKSIGEYAFQLCTGLTDIQLPEGLTELPRGVFFGCTGLSEAELPDTLTAIGQSAFSGCSGLKKIDLPDGISSIGDSAFLECDSLESVTLPEALERISDSMFEECEALKEITIPGSVESIGWAAFRNCTGLQTVRFAESGSLTTIGISAFSNTGLTEVVIPDSVTSLEDSSFKSCKALKSVTIGDGVRTIGEYAFDDCDSVESLTIGPAVETIEYYAFSIYQGLDTLILNAESLQEVDDQAFYGTKIRNLVIGKDVDSLSNDVLAGILRSSEKKDLDTLKFKGENEFTYTGEDYLVSTPDGDTLFTAGKSPYKVDSRGNLVQWGSCGENLTWELNEGVLTISGEGEMEDYDAGNPAPWYEYRDQIESIVIESAKSVGDYAFYDCRGAETVEMPESLESVGEKAFAESGISSVNGKDDLKEILDTWKGAWTGDDTFYRTPLWERYEDGLKDADGALEKTDSSERSVRFSASGDRELLTGQEVKGSLTIEGGEGQSPDTVRVYFQFDNENGEQSLELGESSYDGVEVRVRKADAADVFYVEVPQIGAGKTLALDISFLYKNFTEGGEALIWLEVMSAEEAAALEDGITLPEGEAYHFTWKTRPDQFTVQKLGGEPPLIVGDGTEEGGYSVRDLEYTVSMSRTGVTSPYGKDLVKRVEYTDTLELPEGFRWRDGVAEAVNSADWDVSGAKNAWTIYVEIKGKRYTIATLRAVSGSIEKDDIRLRTDSEGRLQICWWQENASDTVEISGYSCRLVYGSEVIVADHEAIQEALQENGENARFAFKNQAVVDFTFTYSDPQTLTVADTVESAAGKADYTIKKTIRPSSSGITPAFDMGESLTYDIELENPSLLSYKDLKVVEDRLEDYFYIKAEDMEEMLNASSGEGLTITLENAALGTPIQQKVTLTDGKTAILTQQQLSPNPSYDSYVKEEDSDIKERVKITFRRSEEEGCIAMQIIRSGATEEYQIGAGETYESIGAALDDKGYVITEDVTYLCQWKQKELYSGETRSLEVRATVKSSFMRLLRDQPWYILDNTRYADSVNNRAEASSLDGQIKYAEAKTHINRDFSFYKVAFRDGESLDKEGAVINDGDVIEYWLDVNGTDLSGPLPLTDRMQGTQALLASAADNPQLSDDGLTKYEKDGQSYYVLDKEETYKDITIGGRIADSIEIKKTEDGLDTLIHWYLPKGEGSVDLRYPVLVERELSEEGGSYLENESWLGGRKSHRLYDDAYFGGRRVVIQKHILADLEEAGEITEKHDPNNDVLKGRSTVGEGETVTYRLDLERMSLTEGTVEGSAMKDLLPLSLKSYWTKDNVSVIYVAGEDTKIEVSDETENGWSIETDPANPNQQILQWDDDFKITLNGTAYIYVTLTFPEGEAWREYTYAFADEGLKNTFLLDNMQDEVFHDLTADGSGLLQKGVYLTGAGLGLDDSSDYYADGREDSLYGYVNDGVNRGIVTYYIALYNSGPSRMYLGEIQDVLPAGFTFESWYRSDTYLGAWAYDNSGYYSSMIRVEDPDNPNVVYKRADLSMVKKGDGKLSFILENRSGGNGDLSYDEEQQMYYLKSGEAVVFAYNCRTNGYEETEDRALNRAAMPYYNYSGTEFVLDESVSVDRRTPGEKQSNNGEPEMWTTVQAGQAGMDTAGMSGNTQWLVSGAAVERGSIMPGITKTAESPFADVSAPVKWTVTSVNSGRENIRDYTLTDRMMAPYQFTGTVEYRLKLGSSEMRSTLFTFQERKEGDEEVKIQIGGLYSERFTTLTVNGAPIEITLSAVVYREDISSPSASVEITVQAALSRDEDGNETLSLCFPGDTASIPANGSAELTLETTNLTGSYSNASFYNTSWLTLSEAQPFEHNAVTQGEYVEYGGKPSVTSTANVTTSYGYATSSRKAVTELNGTAETENTAVSDGEKNYIVTEEPEHELLYTLTVENGGGGQDARGMDKFVILDSLPQEGDHAAFYADVPRNSDFRINFAGDPEFSVQVNDNGLDRASYTLQFSEKTEFSDDDKDGSSDDGWIDDEKVSDFSSMRSFRLKVEDADGSLIPANSTVAVSFHAVAAEKPEPLETAWNSFGYHYSLVDDETELEASPQKVGVRMAGVPNLEKRLEDSEGRVFEAPKQETFRFLIYEGEALDWEGSDPQSAAEALRTAERSYTLAELTVEQGASSSEPLALKNCLCFAYSGGDFTETETPWKWEDGKTYAIYELPQSEESIYVFGDISGSGNHHTFTYRKDVNQSIVCTNVRNLWTLQALKRSTVAEEALGGAVFALYSPNLEDQITEEEYEGLSAEYSIEAGRSLTLDADTWYLAGIQQTDPQYGLTEWKDLTEDRYYLLELRAPEGYNLNEEPGIFVEKPQSGRRIKETVVTNEPGYEMPETGGEGTRAYLFGGTLLAAGSLAYMGYAQRRRRKEKQRKE